MSRAPLLPLLRAGVALLVAAAVLLHRPRHPAPSVPQAKPVGVWATDIQALPAGELRAGLKAEGALPGQKKPPCAPRVEREVVGACWQPHLERPPCPEGLYEGQGMCLMPVRAAKRPDTSVGQ